ncbi:unnamed protein product [Amoebophrya sp. A25]|nr:unnamed protein product [Amoebophrya sp. A25]|eukprot:GSA25T00011182001.1
MNSSLAHRSSLCGLFFHFVIFLLCVPKAAASTSSQETTISRPRAARGGLGNERSAALPPFVDEKFTNGKKTIITNSNNRTRAAYTSLSRPDVLDEDTLVQEIGDRNRRLSVPARFPLASERLRFNVLALQRMRSYHCIRTSPLQIPCSS